jgi:hypothetical protein
VVVRIVVPFTETSAFEFIDEHYPAEEPVVSDRHGADLFTRILP